MSDNPQPGFVRRHALHACWILLVVMLGVMAVTAISFFNAREKLSLTQVTALQRLADSINSRLPSKAESNIWLEKVTVVGPALLEYRHGIVNDPKGAINAAYLINTLKPKLEKRYQTSPQLAAFRENHIAIRFTYYNRGQFVGSILVPETE